MLFKFTFIPNIEMTERSMIHETGEDPEDRIKEIVSAMYNNEYNVFVHSDSLAHAIVRLNDWIGMETCILTVSPYNDMVFNMVVECVDPTDNEVVLLNALEVI